MKILEFIIEVIKLIKPSFHNKITWFLVVFGTTLISTPLIEKIIDAIFEQKFTISLTEKNDTQVGLGLIGIGLIYNLVTNYFDKYLLHVQTIKKIDNSLSQDKILYEKFLQVLPSNASIDFIKHHDFHNSFCLKKIQELESFFIKWDNVEYEFINQELETIRKELLEKIQYFLYDLSMKTYPLGNDRQTVMRRVDEECNLTQSTKENIVLLNNYGDDIYKIHQKLVRKGRDLLYI